MSDGDMIKQQTLPDDDVVDPFKAWCAANHISEATGRRLIERGDGPAIVRLSARRIGIRRKDNRAWLESRTERPQAA
jgi:predicted DNA-binding transcriptional regulator AlpA